MANLGGRPRIGEGTDFIAPCRRPTSRERSGIDFGLADVQKILRAAAGRNSNDFRGRYTTPVAGGICDLRFIVNVGNGESRKMFEFDADSNQMSEVRQRSSADFWLEEWERLAQFNIVFCMRKNSLRKYANNLLHLCF
ncbi:MAG: hypothetical protein KGQ57_11240, partial [Burkholderiales bacterium]|nr:hypothetical protein [Burkholderiales bacterium]